VRLDSGEAFTTERTRDLFEQEHERLYGHIQPEGLVRISALRVVAEGILPELQTPYVAKAVGTPSPYGRRKVWVDESRGWQDVPIYSGMDLGPGHSVPGPAMIEEVTTTVFIGADDELEIDGANNFLIHLMAS
jgi:N-methylhydantoinase A